MKKSALLAFALLPALVLAASPKAKDEQPTQKGKMVFMVAVGLEDVQALGSSLRHAKVAKESGYLDDVVWLAYGRSVALLDPNVKAVPPDLRKLLQEAKAAGVDIVACGNALAKYGVAQDSLPQGTRVVKAGAAEMARLVALGYQVIRY